LVVLGGYGRTDPLLNKLFYPNGLVTGVLTWYQNGLGFESRCMHMRIRLGGYGRTLTRYLTSPFIPMTTLKQRVSQPRKLKHNRWRLRNGQISLTFPLPPSPCVPLPPPPASSLPVVADPASDRFRAEHSSVTRLLATVVTDPSFESAAASALVTELVAFAAHCRLDYAAGLVAESACVCPPSVGGECALGTDVLEDRLEDLECLAAAAPHLVSMLLAPEGDPDAPDIPTPRSYAESIAGEYSSQWQTAMDAEMASWKSTGTYVDEVFLVPNSFLVQSCQNVIIV
ncbi:unnamed protein product, partial [Closterium sp. NIES-54]